MKSQASIIASLAGAALLLAAAVPVTAQEEADEGELPFVRSHPGYLTTLSWGTGLIDTPVAWTSPSSGDMAFHTAVHGAGSLAHVNSLNNVELGGHASLFQRVEGGFIVHDGHSLSLFGRAVLRRDEKPGPLPGLAVGVRNINMGQVERRDRFGYECFKSPGVQDCHMDKTLTFYGVASDRFRLGPLSASWSAGWGNGLFREVPTFTFRDPARSVDARQLYNSDAEPTGLFGGLRLSAPLPGPFNALHAVGEWNGWDLNTGLALEGLGMELGAYITEAEHLGSEDNGAIYNHPKISINITATTNAFSSGQLRQSDRSRRLEAEMAALEARIEERDREIERLEAVMAEGGMPGEVLVELRDLRESLQERIAVQEREIRRLEAQLETLESRSDQTGGGGP